MSNQSTQTCCRYKGYTGDKVFAVTHAVHGELRIFAPHAVSACMEAARHWAETWTDPAFYKACKIVPAAL